jgi:allantoate deiminase/N-carbamoyl-L-amino-acid hydrolase
LYVEQRCSQDQHAALVGTVGQLQVPRGSTNVIPGGCQLSLDIRAAVDEVRMAAVKDVLGKIEEICGRRSIDFKLEETLSAPAAPCAPWLMDQLRAATGVPG